VREIVRVSLHKNKRTILAPYAFELAGNETFSQLLESLYIAGMMAHMYQNIEI
jgi:uncharacterized protein YbcV (DUF1398 family)